MKTSMDIIGDFIDMIEAGLTRLFSRKQPPGTIEPPPLSSAEVRAHKETPGASEPPAQTHSITNERDRDEYGRGRS